MNCVRLCVCVCVSAINIQHVNQPRYTNVNFCVSRRQAYGEIMTAEDCVCVCVRTRVCTKRQCGFLRHSKTQQE